MLYIISSWLKVKKTILSKKDRLTCDCSTGEVLTTLINDYNNIMNLFEHIYETYDSQHNKEEGSVNTMELDQGLLDFLIAPTSSIFLRSFLRGSN